MVLTGLQAEALFKHLEDVHENDELYNACYVRFLLFNITCRYGNLLGSRFGYSLYTADFY